MCFYMCDLKWVCLKSKGSGLEIHPQIQLTKIWFIFAGGACRHGGAQEGWGGIGKDMERQAGQ